MINLSQSMMDLSFVDGFLQSFARYLSKCPINILCYLWLCFFTKRF